LLICLGFDDLQLRVIEFDMMFSAGNGSAFAESKGFGGAVFSIYTLLLGEF
jgi:hypothetical protein